MEVSRHELTVLLNGLYAQGERRIAVKHPASAVGTLYEVELGDEGRATIHVSKDWAAYANARDDVEREHGRPAVDELPVADSYLRAFLSAELLDLPNEDAIDEFLDRYGGQDLTAGNAPVLAGFDTNLMAWRPAHVLGLKPISRGPLDGYALATGVLDELDWGHKRDDTRPLEDALGPSFGEFFNQPAGSHREGRLGETYYRYLRDNRYADEIPTDRGDEAIVAGYDEYDREHRKEVVLFSNDRDFVERARSRTIPAQRVEFPESLPRRIDCEWGDVQNLLYVHAILFGVLTLPKATVYGVWTGKRGIAWHEERLDVDSRSPTLEPLLRRDQQIIQSFAAME